MQSFEWVDATSVEEAAALLSDSRQGAATYAKAGGLDLLDLMKEGIARPSRVVNLGMVASLQGLRCDDTLFTKFGQMYVSATYPGVVKGWHFHNRQIDNFVCVAGMIKLVLYDGRDGSPSRGRIQEYFIGERNPLLVQVPAGVHHGWKCISLTPALVVNCPSEPYDYQRPDEVRFPPGYYATWSGQFENMERAKEKMKLVLPLTLALIFVLLYLNFRRLSETLIVMLSVPFALVGGVWLMWSLGYQISVAVAVGFIALAGVAAETGVIMLIYLDHAWQAIEAKRRDEGIEPTAADLHHAIMDGAVERVRPKMMTVVAIMAGLLPIMWGGGTGSEVMSRIAAPMVGGMISSTVLTLAVIPAIYAWVKQGRLRPATHADSAAQVAAPTR